MPCAFDPLFARFWLLCLVHKMTLKVYGDYASQPCRAVPLFLRAAKIPHEVVVLKLMAGEQKSDKITKLNPFGIVIQNIFFLSLLLFISKFLFLVAFCWAWWYGLEGIHGHFEVHYQGFWRAWSLVSQGLDGWTKSQWIFALAAFGYSSQLRYVLPGRHSYLQIPQLNCWWPLWYLCRIRFFFRVWMKSQ